MASTFVCNAVVGHEFPCQPEDGKNPLAMAVMRGKATFQTLSLFYLHQDDTLVSM